jgi:hypothetical protein
MNIETDLYVFSSDISRSEQQERFQEIFFDEPLERIKSVCSEWSLQSENAVKSMLNSVWSRPLTIQRDYTSIMKGGFDFLIDNESGLVFRALGSYHERSMAVLYALYKGYQLDEDEPTIFESERQIDKYAAEYLKQGMGAFQSSVSVRTGKKQLNCCESFFDNFPDDAYDLFSEYKIRYMD